MVLLDPSVRHPPGIEQVVQDSVDPVVVLLHQVPVLLVVVIRPGDHVTGWDSVGVFIDDGLPDMGLIDPPLL